MSIDQDPIDPKGLIRESYRIDGITPEECRSIFLDWAISVPVGEDSLDHIRALLSRYRGDHADHPMTAVLSNALAPAKAARRRGGARARRA
jgi:hypothetical protein